MELHLQAEEQLSKLFFAFDKIKYKRLWPRYIVEIYDLRANHLGTCGELQADDIVVPKNYIRFVF